MKLKFFNILPSFCRSRLKINVDKTKKMRSGKSGENSEDRILFAEIFLFFYI